MRNALQFIAGIPLVFPALTWAAGDSGTGSVGELQLSGGQFMMLVGALAVLGVVIWLLAKFLGGK